MKKIIAQLKSSHVLLLLLITIAIGACNTTSQTTSSEKGAATYTGGNDWTFRANTVNPQSGRMRQLSIDYTVTLSGTKFISNLPYFGEATAGADLYSGHGALDFTSTDFVSDARKSKGAWNITIKPKDYNEVQSMDFTFYDNGTAYLSVIMLHRSSISFTGTVEQIKS